MFQDRARAPPPVIFAYFRLAWARAETFDAKYATIGYLHDFTVQLSDDIGLGDRDSLGRIILPDEKTYGDYTKLLARCHVELGKWQSSLRDGNEDVSSSRPKHIADRCRRIPQISYAITP